MSLVLTAILISPIILLLVVCLLGAYVKRKHENHPNYKSLVALCIKYAIIGALGTLVYTIGWMFYYQATTGYDPGNAPAGWVLFTGPLSASVGVVLAFFIWRRRNGI